MKEIGVDRYNVDKLDLQAYSPNHLSRQRHYRLIAIFPGSFAQSRPAAECASLPRLRLIPTCQLIRSRTFPTHVASATGGGWKYFARTPPAQKSFFRWLIRE